MSRSLACAGHCHPNMKAIESAQYANCCVVHLICETIFSINLYSTHVCILYIYVYIYTCVYIYIYMCVYLCVCVIYVILNMNI